MSTWTKGKLTEAQRKDTDIQQVISWISSDTLPIQCPQLASHTIQALWAQRKQLCLKDGLLYRKWYDVPGHGSNPLLQLLLPSELVNSVLKLLHDHTASGGHLGLMKTLNKIHSRFYWVGQRHDVEHWYQTCTECAKRKSPTQHRQAPMKINTSSSPLQRIAMNILGPLPETSNHNKCLLLVGDYFTKWTKVYPMKNMEAQLCDE